MKGTRKKDEWFFFGGRRREVRGRTNPERKGSGQGSIQGEPSGTNWPDRRGEDIWVYITVMTRASSWSLKGKELARPIEKLG